MDPNITIDRNVLVSLLNTAGLGQHTRGNVREHNGQSGGSDLHDHGNALEELAKRVNRGSIGDVSVSGALDRILTA